MRRGLKVKKNRIVKLLLVTLIMCISMTGCFNYRDINKVIFATTILYDVNEAGDVAIYLDCIRPYRSANESSEKGKREIFKGEGSTVLEAAQNINMASSYEVNLSQCRSYIITEKAAKRGIKSYLDVMKRSQEYVIRPYLLVYNGSIPDLFKKVYGEEENIGSYIEDIVTKTKKNPPAIGISINEYLSKSTLDYEDLVVGALTLKDDFTKSRIELNGAAVFRNDILIDQLSKDDIINYKYLMGTASSGIIKVKNPIDESNNISLEIINAKTTTKLDYIDGKFELEKNIWLKCNVGEVQGVFSSLDEMSGKLKLQAEADLTKSIYDMFEKYKLRV